jgi:hypothetical protein
MSSGMLYRCGSWAESGQRELLLQALPTIGGTLLKEGVGVCLP